MAMRYRTLGASGMRVSEICLGTMMFGGETDEAEAQRIIAHARDHGVNFIDSADQYAKTMSEQVIGRAIKAERSKWVLATKAGNPTGPEPINEGQSRRHVMNACDASLKRLGTDAIDLYYVHLPDAHTAWEQAVHTYGTLIQQGKIRDWGLSNVRAWEIAHVCHLADKLGVPRPVALQPQYNLMNRMPEVEVLPAARHFGLGVVPYSPIARGILTGKYQLNATPAEGSRAARRDKRMMESEWRTESVGIAETLKAHMAARGTNPVHWAVAWVLNNGAITSAIAGPRTFAQWTDYVDAPDYVWSADDEALANTLVVPGHPSTPGFTDPRYPVVGRFPRIA